MSTENLLRHVTDDAALRREQLGKLVSYQSLAFPGNDPKQSEECAQLVADMLQELGFTDIEMLDVGGQNPTVWAETRVDESAPTILLYAHYDVQPAPLEQGWDSDPWTMIERGGRLFGRGTADDKAGIVQHLSALRAICAHKGFSTVSELPFNIKVCFEGEEEYGDSLPTYIPTDSKRFAADIFLVCDGGNLEVGKPLLQTTLRGVAELTFSLRTLPNAQHSGAFGGPAPDAFLALTRLVQSMYDGAGNTVIAGVKSSDYEGGIDYSEDLFRRQIEVSSEGELAGTGSIASRLWTRPAATVVGVDMPSVKASSNIVIPEVSAKISLRFPPGQSGAEVLGALKKHVQTHVPWKAEISFIDENVMNAFATGSSDGPYAEIMKECLTEAFELPCVEGGSGGSIPLLEVLQKASPDAEFLLFGPIDNEQANMHGANESVCELELEKSTKAEALFLDRLTH